MENSPCHDLFVELTSKCNLRCIHCYNSSGIERHKLKLDLIKKTLADSQELGTNVVQFTGGETMLYQGLIELLELANELGYAETWIITNGTVFKKEILEKCRDLSVKLQISLDGGTAETNDELRGKGVFNRVLNFLELLNEFDLNRSAQIRCTVSRNNLDSTEHLIQVGLRYDIPKIHFSWAKYEGRARDDNTYSDIQFAPTEVQHAINHTAELMTKYQNEIEVSRLRAHRNQCPIYRDAVPCGSLRIAYDGRVFPCQGLVKEGHELGDLNHEDLPDIVTDSRLKALSNKLNAEFQACRRCAFKSICPGGCPSLGEYIIEEQPENFDAFCTARRISFRDDLFRSRGLPEPQMAVQ
ncbi:MAG: radical SAM protein [Gemmatimonadetes bacterium]|nr:radical SAM protein [Gemmatimonadota bacterium]